MKALLLYDPIARVSLAGIMCLPLALPSALQVAFLKGKKLGVPSEVLYFFFILPQPTAKLNLQLHNRSNHKYMGSAAALF